MIKQAYQDYKSTEVLVFETQRRYFGRIIHHDLPYLTNTHIPNSEPLGKNNIPNYSSDQSNLGFDNIQNRTDINELPNIHSKRNDSRPILIGSEVHDFGDAAFVADPFLFPVNKWHMFFEVYNPQKNPDAAIGHAYLTKKGTWIYDGIILQTEHHLSFPYIFSYSGTIYMLPESHNPNNPGTIRLYEATSFPTNWTLTEELISLDVQVNDTILFPWDDQWWLFTNETNKPGSLLAYHSDSIVEGEWKEHSKNPIIENRPEGARPAGRPVFSGNSIIVFYQDIVEKYGSRVRAYEVTDLSTSAYCDEELEWSPILSASESPLGWNSGRMHHIDPWFVNGEWYCAVDGNIALGEKIFTDRHWSIGMLSTNSTNNPKITE